MSALNSVRGLFQLNQPKGRLDMIAHFLVATKSPVMEFDALSSLTVA
jgi:hypothetical protein